VLVETLRQLGRRPGLDSAPLLLAKLQAAMAPVRVAAIEALVEVAAKTERSPTEVSRTVRVALIERLNDAAPSVRAASAMAMGKLQMWEGAEQLLASSEDTDPQVRRNSLEALTQLRELRVMTLALRALNRDDAELLGALKFLATMGSPAQAEVMTA